MRRRLGALALLLVALGAAGLTFAPGGALADGDPGSDVLVYQPLFLASDAGVPIPQQVRLGALLQAAQRQRFPVRVALIATPSDLGAISALWRQPQSYARFLGIELSSTYTGRLLVVMPDGFGFYWPGHGTAGANRVLRRLTIPTGGSGLAGAAMAAVRSLAASSGISLRQPGGSSQAQPVPVTPAPARGAARTGSGADTRAALIAVALLALALLAFLARHRLGRLRSATLQISGRGRRRPPAIAVLAGLTVVAGAAVAALMTIGPASKLQSDSLATNPELDPGASLSRPAPNFTLTDQFGHQVSLRSYRGRVVLLAFNDSECTTICPLTTSAMLDAKAMLGAAASRVALLGIDANPKATSLEDVLTYSQLHGMLNSWRFLTGALPQLQHVWRQYNIQAAIQAGEVAHTPALFVIDPQGRERKLYVTQQSYAAVGQLGQLLAQEASSLLPGRPAVHTHYSYRRIAGLSPAQDIQVPLAGGRSIQLGPGRPRVLAFFATWDRQITGLASGLEGLNRYSLAARRAGLPGLTAIDEGSVEPTGALHRFLGGLPRPLDYPVAIDRNGQVGDGYEVQGLPWLMVVSASGRVAWYYSVAALGWPSPARLMARVREALARAAAAPNRLAGTLVQLRGSPPALQSVHRQASQLLGLEPALAARIKALRGYPIVLNVWASWCGPCQAEFGLFANASARYGKRVAFLGADNDDSSANARTFLSGHQVSYPSYQTTSPSLGQILPQGLAGTPTTIYISRTGKVVYEHIGQYDAQGTLDADIQNYALAR